MEDKYISKRFYGSLPEYEQELLGQELSSYVREYESRYDCKLKLSSLTHSCKDGYCQGIFEVTYE